MGFATLRPDTFGGLQSGRSPMTGHNATPQALKAKPGQLYGWHVHNAGGATIFVKFYDSAAAPTVGTTTPKMTIAVPAGQLAQMMTDHGISFTAGIWWAVTTGAADTDATNPTAGTVIANAFTF